MKAATPQPSRNGLHSLTLRQLVPGVVACALLATLALQLGRMAALQAAGLSALSLAILIGMLAGNTVYPRFAATLDAGVQLSKGRLLRLGIILYGLRVTLQQVADVGGAGVVVAILMVASTFLLACWFGSRVLQLDRNTSVLVGAGSAICGAAAVLATEPVVKGRPEQVTVAVATVVVFGTVALFLYPPLHALAQHGPLFPADAQQFGVYMGSTIHEVAQVVAAGASVGPAAQDSAVIVKMVRVMLLAPFLVALSAWFMKHPAPGTSAAGAGRRIAIPWFAVAFLFVVVLNSGLQLPEAATGAAIALDNFVLAMAMGALGLGTRISAVRRAGVKPLLLALVLFGWLVLGGAVVNRLVLALL